MEDNDILHLLPHHQEKLPLRGYVRVYRADNTKLSPPSPNSLQPCIPDCSKATSELCFYPESSILQISNVPSKFCRTNSGYQPRFRTMRFLPLTSSRNTHQEMTVTHGMWCLSVHHHLHHGLYRHGQIQIN